MGASVSTSPLPFSAMAGQCDALGTDSRKKLSTWLSHANGDTKPADTGAPSVQNSNILKVVLFVQHYFLIFEFTRTIETNFLTCSYIDSV